jgi:hypothetical protein
MQYESLRRYVRERFSSWRRDRATTQRMAGNTRDTSMSGYEAYDNDDHDLNGDDHGQQEEHHVLKHLEEAFNHWKVLPEKQRSELWRLEALRAYARGEERRKETESKLELALQEAQNLRAQVERLSRLQQPREFITSPPSHFPVGKDLFQALKSGPANHLNDWDYDQLTSKWKAIIASNRQTANGISGQRKLTESHPILPIATPNPSSSINTNGNFHLDNNDAEHEFDDEELRDAEAESDGPVDSSRAPQAMMNQAMNAQAFEPNGEVMGIGSISNQHHVNAREFMGRRILMNLGSTDFSNLKGSDGVGLSR